MITGIPIADWIVKQTQPEQLVSMRPPQLESLKLLLFAGQQKFSKKAELADFECRKDISARLLVVLINGRIAIQARTLDQIDLREQQELSGGLGTANRRNRQECNHWGSV